MKIALVVPKSTFLEQSMIMMPLGVMYLAARLESLGHTTEFFDLNVDKFPEDVYDQIWVSATSPQMQEIRRIGEILSGYKAKSVLGGPAVWANPESCKNLGYTLTVGGESDSPGGIRWILDHAEWDDGGHIDVPISKTLDWVLPPVRRWAHKYSSALENLHGVKIPAATMFTSRGCPYTCSFCESGRLGIIWGDKVRYESLDIVEYQIKESKELGYGALCYYDDILPLNKNRTLDLMILHRKYDMIWRCFLRSDIICKQGGYDYLKELRDGGLVEVFLGVESASNKIKDNVHKKTTIEQDTRILEWSRQLGIRCKVSLIMGLPGESKETINKTLEWVLEYRPNRVQWGRLIPFPGTPLTKNIKDYDLKVEHVVDDDFFYMGHNSDNHSFVSTSNMTVQEIDKEWHRVNRILEEKGISK